METNLAKNVTSIEEQKPKNIKDWLQGKQFEDAVRKALPSHLAPERFIRIALTAIMKTPKLAECSKESLFKALLDLSSLGLEPDGRRAHLIPFENRKKNIVEVQLIIDYKGLIELAKRSGEVESWRAELVCQNDEFSWENGKVSHKVNWLAPRGEALAVYSHVKNNKQIDDYEVMTLDQVDRIRARSKAKDSGPWVSDYEEMAKKTVIRRHSKRLTLSPEFIEALTRDDDTIEIDAKEIKYEEIAPKRLSDAPPAPVNEEPKKEAEQPKPIEGVAVDSSGNFIGEPPAFDQEDQTDMPITPASLSRIMNALKDNPTITPNSLQSYIKSVYGVDSINKIMDSDTIRVIQWITGNKKA